MTYSIKNLQFFLLAENKKNSAGMLLRDDVTGRRALYVGVAAFTQYKSWQEGLFYVHSLFGVFLVDIPHTIAQPWTN
jgi:hypothetical protein